MKAKSINTAQLNRIYWPAWRAAAKSIIASGSFTKAEAEEIRKDIHVAVTGSACSSKQLTNRQLDACLARFASMSAPSDGARQAELADGACNRVRFAIRKIQTSMRLEDSYVESIAVNMHRRSVIQCDEYQLKSVLKALNYHAKRHES